MKTQSRKCPLCNSDEKGSLIQDCPEEWPTITCPSCGMVYVTRAPLVSELYENHSWEVSFQKERKRRSKGDLINRLSQFARFRHKILPRKTMSRLLDKYCQKNGNVLDIGCGEGKVLDSLNFKFQPFGIEPSKLQAEISTERVKHRGGQIFQGGSLAGLEHFKNMEFEAIVMQSYLEHEDSPLEVLVNSYRLLNSKGVLIIKVPNYDCFNRLFRGKKWCGYRFPDHLNYFTPQTLTTMVLKSGFKVENFSYWHRLPSSDNMWLIARK